MAPPIPEKEERWCWLQVTGRNHGDPVNAVRLTSALDAAALRPLRTHTSPWLPAFFPATTSTDSAATPTWSCWDACGA